jgi:hypothetical protein
VLAPAFTRVLAPRGLLQYARMRHQYKHNAWGAKSDMLHDYAQLTHTNPYKTFTNLPLAFLVF